MSAAQGATPDPRPVARGAGAAAGHAPRVAPRGVRVRAPGPRIAPSRLLRNARSLFSGGARVRAQACGRMGIVALPDGSDGWLGLRNARRRPTWRGAPAAAGPARGEGLEGKRKGVRQGRGDIILRLGRGAWGDGGRVGWGGLSVAIQRRRGGGAPPAAGMRAVRAGSRAARPRCCGAIRGRWASSELTRTGAGLSSARLSLDPDGRTRIKTRRFNLFKSTKVLMATPQGRRLRYHTRASLEPRTSGFSTLRINH